MCTCIRVAKLAEIRSIFGIVKIVIRKWRFSRLGGYEMMQWWALCVRAGKREVVGKRPLLCAASPQHPSYPLAHIAHTTTALHSQQSSITNTST